MPYLIGIEDQFVPIQRSVETQDADNAGDCNYDYCYHMRFPEWLHQWHYPSLGLGEDYGFLNLHRQRMKFIGSQGSISGCSAFPVAYILSITDMLSASLLIVCMPSVSSAD